MGSVTQDGVYRDIDGNIVSLDHLCRTEPEWAANRIRVLTIAHGRTRELAMDCVRLATAHLQAEDRTRRLAVAMMDLLNKMESNGATDEDQQKFADTLQECLGVQRPASPGDAV